KSPASEKVVAELPHTMELPQTMLYPCVVLSPQTTELPHTMDEPLSRTPLPHTMESLHTIELAHTELGSTCTRMFPLLSRTAMGERALPVEKSLLAIAL